MVVGYSKGLKRGEGRREGREGVGVDWEGRWER